jgi:hypothetical protein
VNAEILLAAFISVQTADGREAIVNTEQISSMLNPIDGEGNKMLASGVRCVVRMTSARFISAREDCDTILRRVKEVEQP